jgi:hypothetical protein
MIDAIRTILALILLIPALILFMLLVPFICAIYHVCGDKQPVRLFWRHVVVVKAAVGTKYTFNWED